MRAIRCRVSLELHDQCLLKTEVCNGEEIRTYMISSVIKKVNSPIFFIYTTREQPYPDSSLVTVAATANLSSGTFRADVYDVQPMKLDNGPPAPAPYVNPPRLFFDAIILRESAELPWSNNTGVGVFEFDVSVDVSNTDGLPTQVEVRCTMPRTKKVFKTLQPLYITQSVGLVGDFCGWVNAKVIWIEVHTIEILGAPVSTSSQRLDTSARSRGGSPVKGIGRGNGRRGRAHSPVKNFPSRQRASSPSKELSSSFDNFDLRSRSSSPVKDLPEAGGDQFPVTPEASRTFFLSPSLNVTPLQLLPFVPVPEPVKAAENAQSPLLDSNGRDIGEVYSEGALQPGDLDELLKGLPSLQSLSGIEDFGNPDLSLTGANSSGNDGYTTASIDSPVRPIARPGQQLEDPASLEVVDKKLQGVIAAQTREAPSAGQPVHACGVAAESYSDYLQDLEKSLASFDGARVQQMNPSPDKIHDTKRAAPDSETLAWLGQPSQKLSSEDTTEYAELCTAQLSCDPEYVAPTDADLAAAFAAWQAPQNLPTATWSFDA